MNDEHAKQIQNAVKQFQSRRRAARNAMHELYDATETARESFRALHLELVQFETLMEVLGIIPPNVDPAQWDTSTHGQTVVNGDDDKNILSPNGLVGSDFGVTREA